VAMGLCGGGGACFFVVSCFLVEGRADLSESSDGVFDGILFTPMMGMGGDGGLRCGFSLFLSSLFVVTFWYASAAVSASCSLISTVLNGMLFVVMGIFW